MNAIKAIVKDRRIALNVPDDWPEGTEVVIEPLTESIGLSEEDWPTTPEAIADWMAWYESLEPLISRPKRRASWQPGDKSQGVYYCEYGPIREDGNEAIFERT